MNECGLSHEPPPSLWGVWPIAHPRSERRKNRSRSFISSKRSIIVMTNSFYCAMLTQWNFRRYLCLLIPYCGTLATNRTKRMLCCSTILMQPFPFPSPPTMQWKTWYCCCCLLLWQPMLKLLYCDCCQMIGCCLMALLLLLWSCYYLAACDSAHPPHCVPQKWEKSLNRKMTWG